MFTVTCSGCGANYKATYHGRTNYCSVCRRKRFRAAFEFNRPSETYAQKMERALVDNPEGMARAVGEVLGNDER